MRQKTQTPEDSKLCTALENIRHATCIPEDIKFLKTQIAGRGPEQPKLSDREFRNVSIITALNSQKDRINELGSTTFAAETGQTLTHCYFIDRWAVLQMLQKSGPKVESPKHLVNMSPIK
jgi:hypothetical protein